MRYVGLLLAAAGLVPGGLAQSMTEEAFNQERWEWRQTLRRPSLESVSSLDELVKQHYDVKRLPRFPEDKEFPRNPTGPRRIGNIYMSRLGSVYTTDVWLGLAPRAVLLQTRRVGEGLRAVPLSALALEDEETDHRYR